MTFSKVYTMAGDYEMQTTESADFSAVLLWPGCVSFKVNGLVMGKVDTCALIQGQLFRLTTVG